MFNELLSKATIEENLITEVRMLLIIKTMFLSKVVEEHCIQDFMKLVNEANININHGN